MDKITKILTEKMLDADLLLIGIGEEFQESFYEMNKIEKYSHYFNGINEENEKEYKWILSYIKSDYLNTDCQNGLRDKIRTSYRVLEKMIRDKNYFIVSMCQDSYILNLNFKEENIVQPCGDYTKIHCCENCNDTLLDPAYIREKVIYQLQHCEGDLSKIEIPRCKSCNELYVFNEVNEPNYLESGYMQQWEKYTKWLMGTMNRKVCILELGVGIQYPTVVRWPFEKMVYFNQKASFFRIHSHLYQLSKEMAEKGYSLKMSPVDFLQEISE